MNTTMRKVLASFTLCCLIVGTGWGIGTSTQLDDSPYIDQKPTIQIAILLDTGKGMSGLIEQAQKQIWQVVNELTSYRQYGKTPQLQLSLFEYGK